MCLGWVNISVKGNHQLSVNNGKNCPMLRRLYWELPGCQWLLQKIWSIFDNGRFWTGTCVDIPLPISRYASKCHEPHTKRDIFIPGIDELVRVWLLLCVGVDLRRYVVDVVNVIFIHIFGLWIVHNRVILLLFNSNLSVVGWIVGTTQFRCDLYLFSPDLFVALPSNHSRQ